MNIELDFIIGEEDMNEIEEIREMGFDVIKSKFKRFL